MSRRRRSTAIPHGRAHRSARREGSGDERLGLRTALIRQRVAFTIARRTSIRALGRSVLIAAMVALPIAGMAGAALIADSMSPTVPERLTTELGSTQARLRMVSPPSGSLAQSPSNPNYWTWADSDGPGATGIIQKPADLFPAGTRILPMMGTSIAAETATGVGTFQAIEGATWDPAFAGKSRVAEGRAPQADDEVMVTPATLPRLGLKLGDTVRLDIPEPITVTIVGVLDYFPAPDAQQMFFGREGSLSDMTAEDRLQSTAFYLPDTTLDWGAVRKLNAQGAVVLSRSVLTNPPPPSDVALQAPPDGAFLPILAVGGIFGGFAAFEVILLAGAAFTVTARQQQRTLATIASVGATRSTLFRVLSASGVVLGAIGGLVGVALGIGAGTAFMALTNNGSSTQYYGFHLPWLIMLAIVAFAVLIGWISALMPARNASRFDIVAALRGARRPPVSSIRRPVTGLVLLGLGLGTTAVGGILLPVFLEAGRGIPYGNPLLWIPIAMLIAGPVLAQLGLILCAPLLLRVVARLMRRTGIGARLASQDAARNPGRSVPALAAIMTTIFVAVFAMAMLSSAEQNSHAHYQYGAALGTVQAPLTYQERTAHGPGATLPYEHSADVIEAIRSTVPVKDIRTLASVPEPQEVFYPNPEQTLPATTAEAKAYAVPVVPLKNLCPASPDSPDFSQAIYDDPTSPEAKAAQTDPRCAESYTWGSFGMPHIWVGDEGDLAMILGRAPSADAKRALKDGGAVSFYPTYVDDHRISIAWWSAAQLADKATGEDEVDSPVRSETLDAVLDMPAHPLYFGLFVSKNTADAIGLDYVDSLVMASTTTMPTTAQSDALTSAMMNLPDNRDGQIYARVERGPEPFAAIWVWGLVGLSAIIAIAAAAVAIGLARFDGRQDDATLSSLGAGRVVRRGFAFWQGLVIAGAGAVLGSAMGLVPALALSVNPDMPFAAPWLQIGLTAVGVPLLIACGSWLTTKRTRVLARRMTIA